MEALNDTSRSGDSLTVTDLIVGECRVVHALMLRDIKTRFGGTIWGYLITLGWPLSHILLALMINLMMGRLAPYGDSAAIWFSTGIVPFMSFSYMSRFIMQSIAMNRPLLIFPVVNIFDIVLSRAILEVLSSSAVIGILCILLYVSGIDFVPPHPYVAFTALMASFLLGLGIGILNAIIMQAMIAWGIAYGLLTVLLWVISGVLFIPDVLPSELRNVLVYNPVLHCVSWFRSAYYEGYGALTLDKVYVLKFGIIALFLGLALERLVRGRLLQG
jgi:capsular polysaccharide transport system permease protein